MGSNWSSLEREPSPDPWWPAPQLQPDTNDSAVAKEEVAECGHSGGRGRVREEEIEAFKQELARKRELRHEALAALQAEMRSLRKKVEEEQELRQKAEEERDKLRVSTGEELQRELENEREEKKKLLEEKERLMEEVEEKSGLERQVQALKDVSQIGKEMLRIRELQVKELKKKLVEINISSVMAPPEDLRVEYEKQIDNIRKLRTLYEERAAATLLEHRRELEREEARITVLEVKLSDLQKETEEYKEAKKELEEKIEKLESTIQLKEDELEQTRDDLFSNTVQNKSLNSQMTLINNLFSQMLVSPKVDLDRLTRLLKENHGLITDLTAKGDSNEVAALLVDLAGQVDKEQQVEQNQEQNNESSVENVESHSEIASNLTKVWRVMVELLSHHQNSSHTELAGGAESCYKCIQTPTGPRSVISVSQTFLTLKDLILEKNRLVKEVGRLKTLNDHLEHRLGSQEKRLSVVTTELRKTWGVVNKLKAQHKQLHTHEKILRYELQQKRCMLTELKQELEHCRDKWERARQKNTQTEEDWKKLRKEFAARKSRKESNSAESGFEEEDVVHSPPSEPITHVRDVFEIRPNEGSEPELSEEDIEHSDGNSFDTVIDLLDIAYLENQTESESELPFVLCEVSPQLTEISPNLQPLSGSEFTEGLDQIESEDLAAVLDIQYQNQLLGADYNLSLPSSSGSSPIPTENDDFASSEMDISEEDSSLNDNHVHSSPLPTSSQTISEDTLLFGSNSSKNISRFLDGLFVEQGPNVNKSSLPQGLHLDVPSTSQIAEENDTATPLVSNENYFQIPTGSATPLVNNEHCYEFPVTNQVESSQERTDKSKLTGIDDVQPFVFASQSSSLDTNQNPKDLYRERETSFEQSSGSSSSCEPGRNTPEEVLKAREEKLKTLEKQCRSLVSKVMSTSFRSEVISNKLDELHLSYGSSEASDVEDELQPRDREDENQGYLKTDVKSCGLNTSSEAKVTNLKSNTSKKPPNIPEIPSRSSKTEQTSQNTIPVHGRTPEEILEARAARLKRLEDQCKSLFSKMSATSSRSELISNKLDQLHGTYGTLEETKTIDLPSTSKTSSTTKTPLYPEKSEEILIPENVEATLNPEIKCSASNIKSVLVNKEENKASKPPDLVSESKDILNKCSLPGPSNESDITADYKKDRTPEEILEARAERFKRLEQQCKSLVSKMTATSLRSEIISNKLDELHSCYGSSEDTSDNDEHSSSSREDDRRRSTPTSSPRYNRKMARTAEKDKQTETNEAQTNSTINEENIVDRVTMPQDRNSETEYSMHSSTDNRDQPKRTPEEILQARAERLNRLEEQCKSLFSKMSATSQRSDIISNRLEELHGQYGQTSTSENEISSPFSTLEEITPSTSFTNTDVPRLPREPDERRIYSSHRPTTNTLQSQKETNTVVETNSETKEDTSQQYQNVDKSD